MIETQFQNIYGNLGELCPQRYLIMYQIQHFIIYHLLSKINTFKAIKVFCDILAITECQLHIEKNPLESRKC
jgi:hypothetical protein